MDDIKKFVNDEIKRRSCSKSESDGANSQHDNKNKDKKNSPHLAVTHKEQGGAASGRNTPLLMKSMAPDFQEFVNAMTDLDILSVLYTSLLDSDSDTLQNIINKGKQ